MSNTVQRIKEYIDYKRLSVRKFEESIGFSNGAFSSQYKNKKAIGVDKVEKILEVYSDLNPVWLLTGKGDMLQNGYAETVENSYFKVSESKGDYQDQIYKEKYVTELENEVELLKRELKQKQDIIEGFLSGSITKTN